MSAAGVLIVGYGLRGRQWREALSRGRGLRAVAAADPASEALEAIARAGLAGHQHLEEALDAVRPGLAIVASPAPLHAEHAVACLERGCAVLVEKPLAPSLAEAERVVEAAKRAGRPALVGQNFRFLPWERRVTRALADGLVGRLRRGETLSMLPPSVTAATSEQRPHGGLWDFGVHHLDLWRARLGADPEAVEATYNEADTPAYLVRMRFPGQVEVVYRLRERAATFHSYDWIEGEHAALRIELGRVRLHSSRHRPRRLRARRGPAPERALLEVAQRALETGEAGELSAAANLGTVAALEAAVGSIEGARA